MSIMNYVGVAGKGMCGQCALRETLMSEEAEACFVIPLREAVAY
jgi:hypothetical protein